MKDKRYYVWMIWTAVFILEFVIMLVLKQMAFLGIILITIGVGIGMHREKRTHGRALIIGIVLLFFLWGTAIIGGSIPVVQAYYPWKSNTGMAMIEIGTGLIFLWIGIYFVVMQTIFCKRRVRGKYQGYIEQQMQRGGHIYQMMFTYEFQGEVYQGAGLDMRFSKRRIEKNYSIGGSYDIFLNSGAPDLFCVKRGMRGIHLVCILLGVFCIGISFMIL